MDLVELLIFIGAFVLIAALVFVISFFGVKEETFEEALEAQRKKQGGDKKKEKKKEPPVEKKKKVKKNKDSVKSELAAEDEEASTTSRDVTPPKVSEKSDSSDSSPMNNNTVKEEPVIKKKKEKVAADMLPKTQTKPAAASAPIFTQVVAKKPAEVAAVEEIQIVVSEAKVQQKPLLTAGQAVQDVKTTEPAPVAQPETKKKKIEILEVEKPPTDKTSEESVDEKKKKPSKEKKTVASGKASGKPDLLAQVRQAVLTDTETQAIINTLLLKQSGKVDRSDDWIEPGKESEAKKMSRQLSELKQALEDECGKAAGLEKKLTTTRKEFIEEKSSKRRIVEEMTQKHTKEITALNIKVEQLSSELTSANTVKQQLEARDAKNQSIITNLQSQANSNASDPHLAQKVEQLHAANGQLQQELTNAQQLVKTTTEELVKAKQNQQELEQRFEQLSKTHKQLDQQLEGAKQQLTTAKQQLEVANQQLKEKTTETDLLVKEKELLAKKQENSKERESSDELAGVAAAKSHLESQLAAVTTAKQQLTLELSVIKEKLATKETENTRLFEENERLSEQLASSVERPAAEGEEAQQINGHHSPEERKPQNDTQTLCCDERTMWEEKLRAISIENDKIQSAQKQLESQLAESKEEISHLKKKNDETVEKLSAARESHLSLLSRLFPSIPTSSNDFESQAKTFIQKLETSERTEDKSEAINKLELQVSQYKTVLAQTEGMLSSLQASVEKAEQEWKKKLESAFCEHETFKSQLTSLKTRNSTLETELAELQQKHQEVGGLSSELETARSSNADLAKKCTELQLLVTAAQAQLANQGKEEIQMNGTAEKI